jgi:hypothetical protein
VNAKGEGTGWQVAPEQAAAPAAPLTQGESRMLDSPEAFAQVTLGSNIQLLPYP